MGSVGSASSLGPGPGKRISLEAAMMDARIKARNSIFVTSGTNIIEGGIVSSVRRSVGERAGNDVEGINFKPFSIIWFI